MKEFISKLNDRNLQRKRESGITSYALYSAFFLILYHIISDFKSVITGKSLDNIVEFCTYTSNILMACIFILTNFNSSTNESSHNKILKKKTSLRNPYGILLVFGISFPSLFFTTLYSIDFHNIHQSLSVYLIFLLILNYIYIILVIIIIIRSFLEKDKLDFQSNEAPGIESLMTIILAALVIFYSIKEIIHFNLFENKTEMFLLCTMIFVCLLIADKILQLNKQDANTINLENLEYEIHLKNLSDEQIREVLQKNYMGFLINDWIKYMTDLLEKETKPFREKIEILHLKKLDLKTIDKTKYPIEYDGRKKIINDEINSLNKEISTEFTKKIKEIENVIKNQGKLNEDEIKDLKLLYKIYKETFSELKTNANSGLAK